MSGKSTTGSLSATLGGVAIAPPGPPHTYLGVARGMMPGVQAQAVKPLVSPLGLALVAAHVLECVLKAYLSESGSDAAVKETSVRHNLTALWDMAFKERLLIPASPPHWVRLLGEVHGSPYYPRYSSGVYGIVLPAPEPMATELAALVDAVVSSSQERSCGIAIAEQPVAADCDR